jgi:hypothetical protein
MSWLYVSKIEKDGVCIYTQTLPEAYRQKSRRKERRGEKKRK